MDDNGIGDSPEEPKKGKSKTPKKAKDSVLKQKSPAEFFAENKNIAGFDNPGKSLYTTVRELVENSLDSAESIKVLPAIEVTIEEITKMNFNTMIGLVDRERVDTALYDDFESAKAREKRLAKEARLQEIQAKNASLGKKGKDPSSNTKGSKGRGETSFFKVICKDNGRGMPHDDIPNMFGRGTMSPLQIDIRQLFWIVWEGGGIPVRQPAPPVGGSWVRRRRDFSVSHGKPGSNATGGG